MARLRRRRRASKASCSVALLSELEMPEQELTRRAMYDLVWSRPMTKVAEDLGISDVALKKICDKHRVPTPPRGYWAKRDAGKPTKQNSIPQHVRSATRAHRDSRFAQQSGARGSRGFGARARTPKEQAQDGLARRSRADSPAAGRAPGNLGNCESSAQSKAEGRRSCRGERAWLLWDRGWRCECRAHHRCFGLHRTGA